MLKYDRIYNFSAGPSTIPVPVLEEVRDEMMNYNGSGMLLWNEPSQQSIHRHRDQAEADLRELMNIPDNYRFVYSGGCQRNFHDPDELEKNGVAAILFTGSWSNKLSEAKSLES